MTTACVICGAREDLTLRRMPASTYWECAAGCPTPKKLLRLYTKGAPCTSTSWLGTLHPVRVDISPAMPLPGGPAGLGLWIEINTASNAIPYVGSPPKTEAEHARFASFLVQVPAARFAQRLRTSQLPGDDVRTYWPVSHIEATSATATLAGLRAVRNADQTRVRSGQELVERMSTLGWNNVPVLPPNWLPVRHGHTLNEPWLYAHVTRLEYFAVELSTLDVARITVWLDAMRELGVLS